MADQAKDGLPDVVIRSTARPTGLRSGGTALLVTHEAACRWCPESLLTPDCRDAVKWADKHEMSLGHTYTKQEAQREGRGPRDPWAEI